MESHISEIKQNKEREKIVKWASEQTEASTNWMGMSWPSTHAHARPCDITVVFSRSATKRFLNLCLHGFFYGSKCLFFNEWNRIFNLYSPKYTHSAMKTFKKQHAFTWLLARSLVHSHATKHFGMNACAASVCRLMLFLVFLWMAFQCVFCVFISLLLLRSPLINSRKKWVSYTND